METTTTEGPKQRPGFLTTLCILSYIGSGLWALFSLIGTFASGWLMSFLGGMMMSKAAEATPSMAEMQQNMTPEQMEQMKQGVEAAGGLLSMGTGLIVGIFVVSLILAGLSLWGVIKMWSMKKGGFWIYSIVNGLLAILALIGGSWFMGIVGVAFIVMYGLNLKHMA